MNIFISYNRRDFKLKDQLQINELSTSLKELQAIGRSLRTMEKKWSQSDPTAYHRWLGAFVDFYQQEKEGDLIKDVTRICRKWRDSDSKDAHFYSPHSYDNGDLCLTAAGSYQLETSIGEIEKDFVVQKLEWVSDELNLIDSDTIATKDFSRVINVHLSTYKETRDDVYLYNAVQAYFTLKEKFRKKKRMKVNDLTLLKERSSSSAVPRDLRQSYRRLIRFLFKNMEADEDSYVLFVDQIKQSLLTTSKLRNEHKKTYR